MKRNLVLVLIAALLLSGCILYPTGRGVVVTPAPIVIAPPVVIAPGPPGPPGLRR